MDGKSSSVRQALALVDEAAGDELDLLADTVTLLRQTDRRELRAAVERHIVPTLRDTADVDEVVRVLMANGITTGAQLDSLVREGDLRDTFRSMIATLFGTAMSFAPAAAVGYGVLMYPPEDVLSMTDPTAKRLAIEKNVVTSYLLACLTIALGAETAKAIIGKGALNMRYSEPASFERGGQVVPFSASWRSVLYDFLTFAPFAATHGTVGSNSLSDDPKQNGQYYAASALLAATMTGFWKKAMQHILSGSNMNRKWLRAGTPHERAELTRHIRTLQGSRCGAMGGYARDFMGGIGSAARGATARPYTKNLASIMVCFVAAMIALLPRPFAGVERDPDDKQLILTLWAPYIAFSWGLLQRMSAWMTSDPPPASTRPATTIELAGVTPPGGAAQGRSSH